MSKKGGLLTASHYLIPSTKILYQLGLRSYCFSAFARICHRYRINDHKSGIAAWRIIQTSFVFCPSLLVAIYGKRVLGVGAATANK